MSKINIIPGVKEYNDFNEKIIFDKLKVNEKLTNYQLQLLNNYLSNESNYELKFILDESLSHEEGYEIEVKTNQAICKYKTLKGKHNSILTLRQLLLNKENLTTCLIKDEPIFGMRSIMIDISRNKVPTTKTLKKIIDELALVKINNLQLYVEGRSFYFESQDRFYENSEDFLTGKDVLEISQYALDRGIDLVPNLNCFGHMAYWLNQKELNHLALKKDGFTWANSNTKNYAQTIDPYNEEAQEFVLKLFDDMLKYYPNANICTIGGDEPFELLAPTKNPNAKEIYLHQLKKVVEHVHKYNKIPYMWADVAREYKDMSKELGEVVYLDWCYEAKWVDENRLKFYEENPIPFVVCPGTSCWSSFSGKMENMFENIRLYAKYGKKYGAKGMILTDWNDGASLSQIVTNICCYIYGACYSWNDENVDHDLVNEYLDKNIYKNNIAQKVIDLGNYYLLQDEIGYNPWLFNMFYSHQLNGFNYDVGSYADCAALNNTKQILNMNECIRLKEYLDKWIDSLVFDEENEFTEELLFVYRMIRHSLNLNITYLNLRDFRAGIKEVESLLEEIEDLINDYKYIWKNRNKKSEFKLSEYRFILLKKQYTHMLDILEDIKRL